MMREMRKKKVCLGKPVVTVVPRYFMVKLVGSRWQEH